MESKHETARRWRHKARGTTYTEIGRAELQANDPVGEGATLVIYRGDDGKLWAREQSEFEDGRLEVVSDRVADRTAALCGQFGCGVFVACFRRNCPALETLK